MAHTFEIVIKGSADFLHHHLTVDGYVKAKVAGKKKTVEENAQEWRDTMQYDAETKQPFIFGTQLEKCLTEAGAGLKIGKTFLKKLFESGVFVESDRVYFDGIKGEIDGLVKNGRLYVHECLARVPPRTGALIVRYRLCTPKGWQAKFTLSVFHDEINLETLKTVLVAAGRFKGVGNWRPRFGRFEVVSIKAA